MKDRIKLTENLFEEFPEITPAEWTAEIVKDLNGGDIGKLGWRTYEGFTVSPFYTEGDLDAARYITEQIPGEFPYARGNEKNSNDWKINEYIASGSVKEANGMALRSLRSGAEALTFVCEAGHGRISGIPVESVRDMSALLKDIPLDEVPVHFKCGLAAGAILSMFVIAAGKRGFEKNKLGGSVDADPLKALALTGSLPAAGGEPFREIAAMISYLSRNMPSFGALSVSGHHFHDSGACATEELAFTLAAGVEYLDRLTSAGLSIDRISPHMRFSFSIGSNYFMEISKLRAARLLWAHIAGQYGARGESSKKMKIDARTSSWNKTVFDPYVNMLRGTAEAMAAAIGGAETLYVQPLDSTFKKPDEFSRRMARNTQLIIKNESYLDRVIDPSGGSYYIERLTDSLAGAAWEMFKNVEGMGGLVEALKAGFVQGEIEKTGNEKDMDIACGSAALLGINRYPNPDEKGPKKIDSGLPEKALRRSGKNIKAGSEDSLEEMIAFFSEKNSLLGDVLPDEPEKPESGIRRLRPYRGAEPFEELRLAALRHKKETGSAPAVFLLPVGNPSARNARAAFSTNFFGCAGFKIIDGPGFDTAEDGVRAALKSGADIAVICASDGEYPELAPGICKALREKNPDVRILIAGNPKGHIDALKAAGVDDFIHSGSNAIQILSKYQEISGIKKYGEEN